jgi:hypothetical protein
VVNCSHALQEKKDEEQTNEVEVKDRYRKTKEGLASTAGNDSEENSQEETIEEEDILERKSGP